MENKTHNQDNTEPRFSLWQPGITTQRPPYIAEATLKQAVEWMRTERMEQLTKQLRAITDTKQQAAFKRDHLPYATFGGTFNKRQQDALLKPSHLICLDFDHIADPQERSHTQQLLLQDPLLPTLLLFTSPRGEGIKWITRADPTRADHAAWYRAILRYIEQQYQLQPDHAPSNVASACFLCHDPELIFPSETPQLREQQAEKDPALFPLHQYAADHTPLRPAAPAPSSRATPSDTLADVVRATEQIERRQADITQGYDRWLRLALALADGLGEQGRKPFHRLSAISPQYTAKETDRLYDDCLKRHNGAVSIATFFHLAQEAGIDCASHTGTKFANFATLPSGINTQKSPKKGFLPTFDTEWQSGKVANLANFESDGGTSGYTFSDKIPEGQLPEYLLPLLQQLEQRRGNPLQFVMSQEQQQEFLNTFRATLGEQLGQLGPGITASVYRLALQAFRYAMTLTLIRRLSQWQALGNEEKARGIFHEDESALLCDSRDFHTALTITEALVNHTARVYAVLAKEGADPFALPVQLKPKERKVWDRLPAADFKAADFMAAAAAEGIQSRSANRMLSLFKNRYAILIPVKYGVYRKATPAIPQEEEKAWEN